MHFAGNFSSLYGKADKRLMVINAELTEEANGRI